MSRTQPQCALVDPATVALHEIAEPSRLRALVKAMRAHRVQDAPVLLTVEPHGLLVLDGVHRTNALMSLGVPRMLAVVLPRHEVGEPGGWTHELEPGGDPDDLVRRMRTLSAVSLEPDLSADDRVVAQVLTERIALSARATGPGQAGLAAAYHALAQTYSMLPYRRVVTPDAPRERGVQVRWVAPSLRQVESLVAEHGALPAGITRFELPEGPSLRAVGFDQLRSAVDPGLAAELIASLRSGRSG